MIYLPDNPYIWALLFLTGSVIGSFLNVVIYRWPRQESIAYPPSHCEACQHKLAAKDLIPVFSYLRLRGRCRYCPASIPRKLLWVELVTAVIFALLFWHYGISAQLGVLAFYACLFIIIFVIDLEHSLILNKVVYPGIVVAFLLSLYPWPWFSQSIGMRVAYAALGGAIGFILCTLLEKYKFIELPGDVYYLTTLPVKLDVLDVVIIASAAIIICFFATLYPAGQASKLDPVEAIRYG